MQSQLMLVTSERLAIVFVKNLDSSETQELIIKEKIGNQWITYIRICSNGL